MRDTNLGHPQQDRGAGAVFLALCTALILVASGCAAYFLINVMA